MKLMARAGPEFSSSCPASMTPGAGSCCWAWVREQWFAQGRPWCTFRASAFSAETGCTNLCRTAVTHGKESDAFYPCPPGLGSELGHCHHLLLSCHWFSQTHRSQVLSWEMDPGEVSHIPHISRRPSGVWGATAWRQMHLLFVALTLTEMLAQWQLCDVPCLCIHDLPTFVLLWHLFFFF